MKQFFGLALALGLSILFAVSQAGFHSEISRRKGFTKQLLERSSIHARQGVNGTDYRFYNNDTAREIVISLT